MATAAYRHLLRSSRIAFQGDTTIFQAARTEMSTRFRANKSLPASDAAKEIAHAEEVAKILLQNIVQGERQVGGGKEGNGQEGGDLYKLRIHEHTERGDNDTIKMPNGKTVVVDGKKCSDL